MRHSETKKITEGAMMVGLIGMILFLNRQSAGIFESSFYWLLSLPLLVYTAMEGVRWGLITFIAMMLLSLILSTPQTMFYLFSALVVGFFYGYGIRQKWSTRRLLGGTLFFTFLSYVVTTFVLGALFGYNIGEELQLIAEMLDTVQVSLPIPLSQAALIVSALMTVILVVMQSLCTHLLAILILRRLKIETPKVKSYFDLHIPAPLSVLSIVLLIVQTFSGNRFNETVTSLLFVAVIVIMVVYIAYGMSVAMCLMHVIGKQKYMGLLALLLFIPLSYPILVVLGMIDSFKNIKQELKRGGSNGSIRKF